MIKINVNLEAFYGYSFSLQSHISKDNISRNDVVVLIEGGDTSLESLHDKLSNASYNMCIYRNYK